jgi:hypothetical protein
MVTVLAVLLTIVVPYYLVTITLGNDDVGSNVTVDVNLVAETAARFTSMQEHAQNCLPRSINLSHNGLTRPSLVVEVTKVVVVLVKDALDDGRGTR